MMLFSVEYMYSIKQKDNYILLFGQDVEAG